MDLEQSPPSTIEQDRLLARGYTLNEEPITLIDRPYDENALAYIGSNQGGFDRAAYVNHEAAQKIVSQCVEMRLIDSKEGFETLPHNPFVIPDINGIKVAGWAAGDVYENITRRTWLATSDEGLCIYDGEQMVFFKGQPYEFVLQDLSESLMAHLDGGFNAFIRFERRGGFYMATWQSVPEYHACQKWLRGVSIYNNQLQEWQELMALYKLSMLVNTPYVPQNN